MNGTDLAGRLARLRDRPALVVVGLMSGTSADGVDAAVVRLSGEREFELLALHADPHPSELKRRILGAANAGAAEIARLDVAIGERFARCALAAIAAARLTSADVDLVGSHGQTIAHVPPDPTTHAAGATLQIGCAAVIAERTGLPVVSDFRARDVAVGGHGAPLVPYVDHLLFARPPETRVLLNIGGIANATIVTGRAEDVVACDVGPGNALSDALVRLATDGREAFDRGGARASSGRADARLLAELLLHPFLATAPPKSADRDLFGAPLARKIAADRPELALEDRLATAAAFTAEAIVRGVRQLGVARPDRVIASGGGVHNAAIVRELAARLSCVPIDTSDAHGVPSQAKEALAFAILAREFVRGRPANLPRVTGASRAVVLGSFTP